MGLIDVRLEHEALHVARRFRAGAYGPWRGDGVDYHSAVDRALKDLEDRCETSGREDCLRAFHAALLATAESHAD